MSPTQTLFHDALLDGNAPVPDGLSDGQGRAAGRRFDVYRNNVAVSLTEALEVGFPAIRSLIGPENFKKISGLFLRQKPPSTPMIMQYGTEFPAFLEQFAPLLHLRYLGDVARLEQAQREAYHAADRAPVEAGEIERLSPDLMAQARLELAPALRVLRSPWPVHGIWRYACQDGAPKPAAVAEDVVITRPEFDPVIKVLPPGGAVFLNALRDAHNLTEAAEAALGEAPGFDLAEILGLLLAGQAITAVISPKEQST
ncbi:DNA-binding domain-containing protein [Roseovarius sp. EGI FJ00037]|uniref:HvfC/BufC N-terminal domain-containing protein n=1 Tax=Roseovarius TaxID=74030 RepID=UPI0022A8A245|nr:DNA-binding domain-containing protein [Roseovarius sp. EGI FJ00037]MCZ0812038.1 DNA-binding domain-containing protein [Roseovarius sp. EGI FJ00037]